MEYTKSMSAYLRMIALLAVLGASSFPSFAIEPVYSNFFGKAIKGYDPVAYFKNAKATEGDSDFSYEWNRATWYFANAQNRAAFIKSPEQFAPEYGGYCAWAVSQGYTAKIDPEAWRIEDGKLYLNYSRSVQETWEQDIPGNIAKADIHWPKLLAEQ
jgi:YHS domain-containing protein